MRAARRSTPMESSRRSTPSSSNPSGTVSHPFRLPENPFEVRKGIMEIRKSLRYCVIAAFALGFAAVANTAHAQGTVISGKVTNDQGRDIAGANVIIPELNISVATNPAGNYTIQVPTARLNGSTTSLRVRAIGYI